MNERTRTRASKTRATEADIRPTGGSASSRMLPAQVTDMDIFIIFIVSLVAIVGGGLSIKRWQDDE
jgi:hypothetical protein